MLLRNQIVVIVFLLGCLSSVSASEILKNQVLGLYYSDEPSDEFRHHILHKTAEPVLNHLGVYIKPWNLKKGLPSAKVMQNQLGVISWFRAPPKKMPKGYFKWLTSQMNKGKKVVILENPGGEVESKRNVKAVSSSLKKAIQKMGMQLVDSPALLKFLRFDIRDSSMLFFETKSKPVFNTSFLPIAQRGNEGLLTETYYSFYNPMKKSFKYAPVFTSKYGGMVWGDLAIVERVYKDEYQTRNYYKWRINPFRFFREALGLQNRPVWDTNLKNGRRIFYSHIDGDGFLGKSLYVKGSSCSQVALDSFIVKYPFPITVSFITAEIFPNALGNKKSNLTAQKIIANPKVELASHTFSHPFVYNSYQRMTQAKDYEVFSLEVPNYVLNMNAEVKGSIDFLNKFSPSKKTEVMLWSGNCEPDYKALSLAQRMNVVNMNGGDSRMDSHFKTYSTLSALGFKAFKGDKSLLQVYTSNANETIYTNVWEGPFYAYQKVIETFENTKTPILIKPVNIYYHFYGTEKRASYEALKKAYEYAMKQDLNAIQGSEFIKRVDGFYENPILLKDDKSFEFKPSVQNATLRFDGETRIPALGLDDNILGYKFHQNSLYIFLNKAISTQVKWATQEFPQTRVYLNESSGHIKSWNYKKNSLKLVMDTWNMAHLSLAGFEKGARLKVRIKDIQSGVEKRYNDKVSQQSDFVDIKLLTLNANKQSLQSYEIELNW